MSYNNNFEKIMKKYNVTQEEAIHILEKTYTDILNKTYNTDILFAKFINNQLKVYSYTNQLKTNSKEVNIQNPNHASLFQFETIFNNELLLLKKEKEYNYFKDKVGQLFEAVIVNISQHNTLILRIDGKYDGELILHKKQAQKIGLYSINTHIYCILDKVYDNTNRTNGAKSDSSQLIFENHSNHFISEVLKVFIPQMNDKFNMIEIANIARNIGHRTKVVVRSTDPQVNAVSICIGKSGDNVKQIKDKVLFGEPIDFIEEKHGFHDQIISYCYPLRVCYIDILSDNTIKVVINDTSERDQANIKSLTHSSNKDLIALLLFGTTKPSTPLIFCTKSDYENEQIHAKEELCQMLISHNIESSIAEQISRECSEITDLLFINTYNINKETREILLPLLEPHKQDIIRQFVAQGGEKELLEYIMFKFSKHELSILKMYNIITFKQLIAFTNPLDLSQETGLDISTATILLRDINSIINTRK